MAWVKLDDGFPDHPKVLAAGASGVCLWVCGLAYANRQPRHDGVIPAQKVSVLYPMKNVGRAVAALVECGLWAKVEGGYQIHNYHAYQQTAEERSAISAKRTEAGRRGGTMSAAARAKQIASPLVAEGFNTVEAKFNPVPVPVPVPVPKEELRTPLRSPRKRGALAHFKPETESFTLDRAEIAKGLGLTPERTALEWAKFSDHEFAAPKSDWTRTWRNWCRKAASERTSKPFGAVPSRTPSQQAAWEAGEAAAAAELAADRRAKDDLWRRLSVAK